MQVIDSEGYLKVKLIGGPAGPFVPYTGATGNVDLGEYEIKVGQLELDQTPTGTAGIAVMRWNDADGTADLGLKGGNVTLQIGQEQVTRVVNKTGINLLEANYQAVRVDGAQGNRLKVALAQADNDANSADTLGLVTETINDNQEGFVTVSGLVRNINTTGSLQTETWLDGDVLYLSGTVAGRITNIKPTAPIHTVIMGYVVRAHATQGQIYVKIDNGYELDELHNVAITTPLNNQVLQYETATSLWKNKTISTGITIGTTAITSGTVGRVLFQGTGNVVSQSANFFWDNTNNRLGIGSSSPSGLVHLFASANTVLLNFARASNNATKAGWFQVDASDNVVYTSTNGALDFKTNWNGGTQLSTMYLNSNGTVGIGTSTLTTGTPLTIQGASNNGLTIRGNSTSDRYKQFIGNGTTYTADEIFLQAINTNLNILGGATGTTNWLTIKSTGNVLINTTTDAGFKLDVNGTARVQSTLTVGSSGALGNISTGSAQGLDFRVPYLIDFTFEGTRTHRLATNRFGLNSFIGNNIGFGYDTSGANIATAKIEIGAGTATAGTAPLKLRAGTNLTTPENGAFEYDGTNLYFTVGGVRKTVVLL